MKQSTTTAMETSRTLRDSQSRLTSINRELSCQVVGSREGGRMMVVRGKIQTLLVAGYWQQAVTQHWPSGIVDQYNGMSGDKREQYPPRCSPRT